MVYTLCFIEDPKFLARREKVDPLLFLDELINLYSFRHRFRKELSLLSLETQFFKLKYILGHYNWFFSQQV